MYNHLSKQKDKVNVTLDLVSLGTVNELDSTFKVKMGWSSYWRDPWWRYVGLEAVFNGTHTLSSTEDYAALVDLCLDGNIDETKKSEEKGATPIACTLDKDLTTGCSEMYDTKGVSGLPGLEYYNVHAIELGLTPAVKNKFHRRPSASLAKPIKLMGGGNEWNTGTCTSLKAFVGCPFDMAITSMISKVTFRNDGWDRSWYPFDSRTFYMSFLTAHSSSWTYSFPEMPKTIRFDESAGWDPDGPMTCITMSDVGPSDVLRDATGVTCSLVASRQWASPLISVILPLFLSIITVWVTFYAPLSAAMPRVAVTALAYVTMGSTFNSLDNQLPATGGNLCWIQYVLCVQLVVCVQGTSCHLLLFMYAEGGTQSHLSKILNRTMQWYVPIAYFFSFPSAFIFVLSFPVGLVVVAATVALPAAPIYFPAMQGFFAEAPKTVSSSADQGSSQQPGITLSMTPPSNKNQPIRVERMESLEAAIGRLDAGNFQEVFRRYDLDGSGYIDSKEELTQLTMATIYRLGLDKETSNDSNLVASVDLKVNDVFATTASEGVKMSEARVKEWLARSFVVR